MKFFVVLLIGLIAVAVAHEGHDHTHETSSDAGLGRGFGDRVQWYKLEEGLAEVKSSGRPGMVVIHASWCGACRRLGPLFAASDEIAELSKQFVMINVQDKEYDDRASMKVDGAYVPRIYFTDKTGEVRHDIQNTGGNPSYRYFYPDVSSIVTAMTQAIENPEPAVAPTGAKDEL